jgi:ABC-type transport system substrate-binding protein
MFCNLIVRHMSRFRFFAQATSLALTVAFAATAWAASSPASSTPNAGAATAPHTPQKVLRLAFIAAETGFDPVRISDEYSNEIVSHMIEPPLTFDFLADPVRLVPLTAAALPEHSPDYKVWTIHIQPSIYFADDPAFNGKKRELTAADYAYSIKRYYDARWKSPQYSFFRTKEILGLEALRQHALDTREPFDYDAPVAGLQTPDRYTLRITLGRPDPQFAWALTNPNYFGAVAREVVERYGIDVDAHPVGTGPFKLAEWRRSSKTVLVRNPNFREVYYDAHPAADDAAGQAILKKLKGRRIPMVDRIEFNIIEASQPLWLSFLNGDLDELSLPNEFAPMAIPGGKLAHNLVKKGIGMQRELAADHTYVFFNMEDPVLGGYTPDKIALRRAISLAYDNDLEVSRVRRGLAMPATQQVVPHTIGYDPTKNYGFSEYDPGRAQALLDLYGYVDKNGDGWRDMPDGSPLVLHFATQDGDLSRQFNELWDRAMKAIHVRMVFDQGKWPDQLKLAEGGKLQIWSLGNTAISPDPSYFLHEAYGPESGSNNLERFKLPAYDDLVTRIDQLPDGPERQKLLEKAQALLAVYMPQKPQVYRIGVYLTQPWLVGFRHHPFAQDIGRYVDIDTTKLPADSH